MASKKSVPVSASSELLPAAQDKTVAWVESFVMELRNRLGGLHLLTETQRKNTKGNQPGAPVQAAGEVL